MYKSIPIKPSEITPKSLYLSRRDFIKSAGVLAGSMVLAACASGVDEIQPVEPASTEEAAPDDLTSYKDITTYNNYYEFSLEKTEVATLAKDFTTSPWTVEVYGLVNKPQTFGMEDILKLFPQEERIYRMRCVEAWSMVIPWNGFPLASLLNIVEPTSSAKFVRFETVYRPEEMKAINSLNEYPFPYQEGLRLDEAMNELTLLATGLYGETMLPQNGAPIRLVVPWKYGFKSIKSIVKIELIAEQPATLWNTVSPREYGFYANVNPKVQHPRWSQVTERRIGEMKRRKTLMFNGYAEQVAHLYEGMDLTVDI
ncbi:MAG TPA: protein-methionine-sulfoxide reductase catalytic subunit MsrP [Anaerolineales bacterium]|nr:protein-methionine-sulfoxide reductase catalytic subunit MsrP [Anaerolineales bacterium]